jgi:aromatic ring-opening dioxygenase catalytic subunit (LigB family)
MASLVGCFAASHAPLVARDWHLLPQPIKDRFTTDYQTLGKRCAAVNPDVIIAVTPDHWVNFFINNLPAVCLAIGESHDGPPEPFLKDFPWKQVPGHPGLGLHIAETALDNDFEPSLSYQAKLDHGLCIPLWRMELPRMPAIIPMFVNDLEPPMLSVKRCFAWGRLLAKAIASYPENLRVAILATGGLSHSIGEATMGWIDEPFDHEMIKLFREGGEGPLTAFLTPGLPKTGNGTHEVRNWIIAHAAAGNRGFDLIDYVPVPEVYVGCGFASWTVAQEQRKAA